MNIRFLRMNDKKYAMFIGRWQPFCNEHFWLVDQKLIKGVPVLIMIRDTEPDSDNPLTSEEICAIFSKVFEDNENVKVMVIPDIESINHCSGGSHTFVLPGNTDSISSSEIKKQVEYGSNEWKNKVPSNLAIILEYYFKNENFISKILNRSE